MKFIRLFTTLLLLALAVQSSYAQFGFTNVDAESVTVMAGALHLDTSGWVYYNGADAPGGAYFARFGTGVNSITGTVTLPQTLAAGRYYVFFVGIDYDQGKTLRTALGTGSYSEAVALDDRDDNRLWTKAAVVDLPAASNSLKVIVDRNPANTTDQMYLLMGLYVTSNSLEKVDRYSTAIKLVYPTVMSAAPAVKGNLIVDGGFEAGIGAGWGFNGTRTDPPIWDNTQAYEGRASWKIPIDHSANAYGDNMGFASRTYHLKPNTKYSASIWVKTSPGQTVAVAMWFGNAYTPTDGSQVQPQIGAFVYATDQWQRLVATGYALDYPTPDYQIHVMSNELPNGFLWVDGVQLEEGDPTPFRPNADLVAGVQMRNQPGNIFYEDEPLNGTLVVRNYSTSSLTGSVGYEMFDWMNRRVKFGSLSVSVAAQTVLESSLNISAGRGIFRLVTWVEGMANTETETVYAVIPRPFTSGLDTLSALGVHPNYVASQLALLQKLGIKWGRALSPSGFFRWSVIEPTEGQILWYDAEILRAKSYGITTLGTIGTNDYWPRWADNGGLPDLTKWQTFVGKLALHYKGQGIWWEIWNEPSFTADFYAQMLKLAVDAIELNDPDAKIVGMGGTPLSTMEAVIAALKSRYPTWDWKQHIDVMSMHGYPGGEPPERFTAFVANNVPVWNTESGYWDRGFYQGVNSSFTTQGKNLWPYADAVRYYDGMFGSVNSIAQIFIRSVASGVSKYFYYDSRAAASPEYPRAHTTMIEWDGTVRAKGVAYSIAGNLLNQATTLGEAAIAGGGSSMLVFDTPKGPLAVLYSVDNRPRQITLPLQTTQFQVLDLMGNVKPANGSVVNYGRVLVWVRGIGITAAALKGALQTGVVTNVADTTPPAVSISEGPRGQTGNSFRFRYIAVDDTSYPNTGEITPETKTGPTMPDPESIQYAYNLQGTWSPWTSKTYIDFTGVPNGVYTFSVKARDAAGNESIPATRSIVIGTGGGGTIPPPAIPTLTNIVPTSGELNSTVAVTLTGTGFVTGATTVNAGPGILVSNVVVASPTQIGATFNISGAVAGLHLVTATTVGGTTSGVNFTVTIPPPPVVVDTTPPVPGNYGAVSSTPVTATTIPVRWVAATDNVTPQQNLMYAVYLSRTRISTVAQAKASAKVMDYQANVTSFTIGGLQAGTFYYPAVVVQDAAGNEAVYQVPQRKTSNH